MKYLKTLIMMFVGLGCVVSSAVANVEIITIAADPWCPFTCDAASEHPGYMVEIAQRAFKKHGIDVKYTVEPWARVISETRVGNLTAIVGASKGDAPDFIFPSVIQGRMENAFYVKSGNSWRYTDVNSLAKVCVGVITDYSYSENFNHYIEQHKNNPARIQFSSGENSLEINIKKLLANRIDAVIEATAVMDYYLSNHPATTIQEAGRTQSSEQDKLYIAFSPKNPASKKYAKILADETKAMRASGELQTILDAYRMKDWE